MSGILRKIDLEGLDESFYEDDITPDIDNRGFRGTRTKRSELDYEVAD